VLSLLPSAKAFALQEVEPFPGFGLPLADILTNPWHGQNVVLAWYSAMLTVHGRARATLKTFGQDVSGPRACRA